MATFLQQPLFLSQRTVHTLTLNKNLNLFSKMATSITAMAIKVHPHLTDEKVKNGRTT